MYGFIFLNVIFLIILTLFWINPDIDLKWKTLFTFIALISKFILPGLWSIFGLALTLIIMIIFLILNGENIR